MPVDASSSENLRSDYYELELDNTQGNVIAGFKQDFQTLVYIHIDDPRQFKQAVDVLRRQVTTARTVRCFRHPDLEICSSETMLVSPPWMNIAFSFFGLNKLLKSPRDAAYFADKAFRDGAVGRVGGDAKEWVVRDGDDEESADVLIIVAGRTESEVSAAVGTLKRQMREIGGATVLEPDDAGASLGGAEHFGYRDGISQPGIRGYGPGLPGQDLIWPGEFVFGKLGQVGSADGSAPGRDSRFDGVGAMQVPAWGVDGAYLVFRRFRQDVSLFHERLHTESQLADKSPQLQGARIVGRWRSGAPIMRSPDVDDPTLGADDDANNYFLFRGQVDGNDSFRRARPDPDGVTCPVTAHIRNAFPRDDVATADHRQRRILRRGIPFGQRSLSTIEKPVDDPAPRGLLFLAYMTNISRQFEGVNDGWSGTGNVRVGGVRNDDLLGRSWITLTGGGNYFAPSLTALREQLSGP